MMTPENKKRSRFYFLNFSPASLLLCFSLLAAISLMGCATTRETTQLRSSTISISNDLDQLRDEVKARLSAVTKDQESLRRQFMALSTASENRDDKVRTILGKLDELDHQLQTYWKDTKAELTILKAESVKAQTSSSARPMQTSPKQGDTKYETVYKDAFDAFQKGSYEEAVDKFSGFVSDYPEAPLVSNAYYWLGESYMSLKNYEKAIVSFQEVIDKYPASDKASRALLSQAEAFASAKDEKSSITILKKVIELYPKTEEATIAERKLRNLGLR